jgi:hypothetical protein
MPTTLTEDDLPDLASLVATPETFIEKCLHIRVMSGRVERFQMNRVQKRIREIKRQTYASGRTAPRFIVLKARRHGVTTLEQAESFYMVATKPNRQAVTLAHDRDTTEKIFRISSLYHDTLHPALRPRRLTASNKRDLNYRDLNSLLYVGTAGARGFGRADTLQRAHWSEVAWSPGDDATQKNLLVGLTEACREGEVVLESTPQGVGGLFHDLYQESKKGLGSWTPILIPWWEDDRNVIALEVEEAHELVKSYTDAEKRLVELHGLAPTQVAWRRQKMVEPEMQDGLFYQEYLEDDVSCFLASGTTWFDMQKIDEIARAVGDPFEVKGYGEVEVYEKPKKGHEYVIGADVGEGLADGNYSVLGVLDKRTANQAACVSGRWDTDRFADIIAEWGKVYGTALVGVERNNHGHAVLKRLRTVLRYPRLYRHRDYDAKGGGAMKLGWETNGKTRPILLQDLRAAVHQGHIGIRDRRFLDETRTFVHLGEGKYGTKTDKNFDDRIFAWGIAWQIRASRQATGKMTKRFDPAALSTLLGSRIYTGGGNFGAIY